ncbi:carbohydrate-binding protein [Leifsonia sp. ZF2019]|uniref:glycoside hydrolase family 66 protein n=1 Tax=Leifsonia sp. ZF2019 TaxID=2781978 RepID=UPI001CBCC460|nr:glycoside hydrolase family 66 protein [Leifsonia sp. ZF2019]UAJ79807.1 carbohydrate-binding protein [Leifsonia sp. ZF2019]
MSHTPAVRARRVRNVLTGGLAAVATIASLLVGSAAYASGGTPTLTSAYVSQARYAPGASVTVTAVVAETSGAGSWSGPVGFTVSHLGSTVATGTATANVAANGTQSVTWNTTAPSADFTGYLVTVTAGASTTQTAIDVSSDWKHFPRFAALTTYPSGTTTAQAQADVDQLVREYHINAFQFYDWMWRHENPIERNANGTLASTWTAWNGDVISPTTVQNYILAVHNDSAAAMPYSMSYAALQNYQSVSGVDPNWALKYASTGQPWAFEMKPNQPSTNLYMFNPANTSWQNYITAKYVDEANTMGFDGVHLDQLGNWGAMTDTSNNPVDLPSGLASLVAASRSALGTGKALGFNAVDGYGGDNVASGKQTDYLYSELWDNHETYTAMKTYLDTQKNESAGIPSVIAAYPNTKDDAGPTYEAENATLSSGLTVDSDHAGYTGTGFVANYGNTGDTVTFTITAPETRRYSLVFRYANGAAGDATRSVAVDGTTLGNVTMPTDGNWNNWHYDADIVTPTLTAGTHTVTISVGSSNTGFVNLDNLVLGTLDTNSVELEDAAIAASGATNIGMAQGDSMLSAPYFPDHDKQMTNALRAWEKNYYDFITAYENLLYGPDVHSVDSGSQFLSIAGVATSGDASANTVWTDLKKTSSDDVVQLVNLLGNDNTWRDAGKATPPAQTNLAVKYYIGPNESPTAVHVATPDSNNDSSTNLSYTIGTDGNGRYISFTVPKLNVWDMIYIDRGFTTPSGNQYEAENAVLTNVTTNTDHAGYTGNGFVDNFYQTSSGVSFTVSAATSGNYHLTLRYGNGGSTATRIVAVDGQQVATPTFPAQGTWDSWTTVSVPVTLTPGLHTVVIWCTGGSGAINLDNLTVGP